MLKKLLLTAAAGSALLASSAFADNGWHRGWDNGWHHHRHFAPAVVYVPAPRVYYAPAPVYVPAPVYAPRVAYPAPVYAAPVYAAPQPGVSIRFNLPL